MELTDFNQWLSERNMQGFWAREPRSNEAKPFLWKWSEMAQALEIASDLVPMDKTGRRNVGLRNPTVQGGLTNTIGLGLQIIKPGEIAQTHRHVASAIRFIIKGSPKAFTIIEGERFPMEEGDLITTPNWTWHDHYNGSEKSVAWLDGLDVRLLGYLNAQFSQEFFQERQVVEKPDGYSNATLGYARPSWLTKEHLVPPFRYPWSQTEAALSGLKTSEGDPFDAVRLEYVNPVNGGHTCPTFSCEAQLLRPREKTRAHRHTNSTVYYVFRGAGVTKVETQEFRWARGDILALPPWKWHQHENPFAEDAILFSINDRPVLEVLGLYREEAAKR
jgi:gentisate 1,2-dioxygenase